MPKSVACFLRFASVLTFLPSAPAFGEAQSGAPLARQSVREALENVAALKRPGEDGYATFWDGNKYVQCRPLQDGAWRCEAAGTLMQPSLERVLTPERAARLIAVGWRLDPSFGNYVQTYAAEIPLDRIAASIAETLEQAYAADLGKLQAETNWVRSEKCPPRNGPSQNLAGVVNDAPSMRGVAIHACAYTPSPALARDPAAASAESIVARYGKRVASELQRLRVNMKKRVYFALNFDSAYVQCESSSELPGIYCEAESADSWPVLASVLTPERLAKLHAAGYVDPGYSPNYSKNYPSAKFSDDAIARELLTILFEVYGYDGRVKLDITTEKDQG